MGYHLAGFDVVGVDIRPQPNYPFTFVQGDAIEYAHAHAQDFLLVHLSPPCQSSCALTKGTNRGRVYADLIPQVREVCEWYGVDWIMENVSGADMRRDVTLCGEQFGLGVLRHRHFELGWIAADPARPMPHRPHRGPVRGWRHGVWRDGPYIAAYGRGGGKGNVPEMQRAMGIWWTDVHAELTEAIPPAYTEWLGREWLVRGEWNARAEPDAVARLARLRRTAPGVALAA
ncbi:DNA methylase [Streptomyces olivaceus]|uniref:DNA methylase n=1 Tax=Streptomyces olivaceus TaxID=47716 RepID=UPI0027E0F97D|nr:DNA methylase [Streptomyces olivaceus]